MPPARPQVACLPPFDVIGAAVSATNPVEVLKIIDASMDLFKTLLGPTPLKRFEVALRVSKQQHDNEGLDQSHPP